MKNEIYDINKIYWFISKSDKNSKINSIAVPFWKNEKGEMQNLLYDWAPLQTTDDGIIRKLNAEINRNNFKYCGDMKSVLGLIVHLNFLQSMISEIDIDKKQNATMSDVYRVKAIFERSVNKREEINLKERTL